jgi:hypothetical protein
VEEAAEAERNEASEPDGAVGLVSAEHPFDVLADADITPEEQLADEEDPDEPAPGRPPTGTHVDRDDRRR